MTRKKYLFLALMLLAAPTLRAQSQTYVTATIVHTLAYCDGTNWAVAAK